MSLIGWHFGNREDEEDAPERANEKAIEAVNIEGDKQPLEAMAEGMEPAEVPLATGCVKSRLWRSETPFVPPRHFYRGDRSKPKMRESDSPEPQLIECLHQAGVTTPGEVRRLSLSEMQPEPLESLPPTPLWSIVRAPGEEETPFAKAVAPPQQQQYWAHWKSATHWVLYGKQIRQRSRSPDACIRPFRALRSWLVCAGWQCNGALEPNGNLWR
jgi:hypothetical protein